MTGIIIQLPDAVHRGMIRTLDGSRLPFSATAVRCDPKLLIVGQKVRFDVDRGWPEATAIRALVNPPLSDKPPDLRYRGFDQEHDLRRYKFEAVASDGSLQSFVVTVEVELFHRHRVNIQEGPVLCMRKLLADLTNAVESGQHTLSEGDLRACALARALAAQQKEKSRRGIGHGRRRTQPLERPADKGV